MLKGLHQSWRDSDADLSGRPRASDLGVGLTAVALALDHDGPNEPDERDDHPD